MESQKKKPRAGKKKEGIIYIYIYIYIRCKSEIEKKKGWGIVRWQFFYRLNNVFSRLDVSFHHIFLFSSYPVNALSFWIRLRPQRLTETWTSVYLWKWNGKMTLMQMCMHLYVWLCIGVCVHTVVNTELCGGVCNCVSLYKQPQC